MSLRSTIQTMESLQGNVQLNPGGALYSSDGYAVSSDILTQDLEPPKPNPSSSITSNLNYTSQPEEPPSSGGICSICSFDYYKPYFNVSHQTVVSRIVRSFTPWRRNFFDIESDSRPDLYGPFWILTTIIFLLSLMGNIATYLNNLHQSDFYFRMELIRYGAIVVYSFGLGFPVLFGFLLRFFEANVTPFQMLCLYGYSLSCFIPILALCVLPLSFLQWILMIYGILNSSVFLILNLNDQMASLPPQKKYLSYGLLAACQIALFLTFKLVFFKNVFESKED